MTLTNKTISMTVLIAIATVGAIGIGIGTETQSAQAQERPIPPCVHPNPPCMPGPHGEPSTIPHGEPSTITHPESILDLMGASTWHHGQP